MKRISKTRILMYNRKGKKQRIIFFFFFFFFDVKDRSILNKGKRKQYTDIDLADEL